VCARRASACEREGKIESKEIKFMTHAKFDCFLRVFGTAISRTKSTIFDQIAENISFVCF
jgi:hypothetical protein